MVQLTCITTRGGDSGKTSLGDGRRLSKHSLRIEAIGAVDELNCFIGQALTLVGPHPSPSSLSTLVQDLEMLQNDLFDMGSDLCLPEQGQEALRINHAQVLHLEKLVEKYNGNLAPLSSFVLPGGTPLAGQMHVCRAVARRTERCIIALHQDETLNAHLLCYMNRLSDLFFVMARVANDNGNTDILWVPGKYQTA